MEFIKLENNKSLVRILSCVEGIKNIDIYINGSRVYENVQSLSFSDYKNIDCGNLKFEIYQSLDTTTPVLSQMVNIHTNNVYTISLVGNLTNMSLLIITDKVNKTIKSEESALRIINLYCSENNLDIYLNNDMLLDDLAFKQGCDYIDLESEIYHLKVLSNQDNSVLLPLKVNLKKSRIYTVYLMEKENTLNGVLSVDGNTYVKDCIIFY